MIYRNGLISFKIEAMKKDNTQNKNNNSNKPITSNIVLSVIVLVIGLAMLVVGIIFLIIPLMAIGGSIVTLGIIMLCHFSRRGRRNKRGK